MKEDGRYMHAGDKSNSNIKINVQCLFNMVEEIAQINNKDKVVNIQDRLLAKFCKNNNNANNNNHKSKNKARK